MSMETVKVLEIISKLREELEEDLLDLRKLEEELVDLRKIIMISYQELARLNKKVAPFDEEGYPY